MYYSLVIYFTSVVNMQPLLWLWLFLVRTILCCELGCGLKCRLYIEYIHTCSITRIITLAPGEFNILLPSKLWPGIWWPFLWMCAFVTVITHWCLIYVETSTLRSSVVCQAHMVDNEARFMVLTFTSTVHVTHYRGRSQGNNRCQWGLHQTKTCPHPAPPAILTVEEVWWCEQLAYEL